MDYFISSNIIKSKYDKYNKNDKFDKFDGKNYKECFNEKKDIELNFESNFNINFIKKGTSSKDNSIEVNLESLIEPINIELKDRNKKRNHHYIIKNGRMCK